MKYFKYFLYLSVAIGFSVSIAGSYDDFFVAIRRNDPATIRDLLRRGFDPNTPSPRGEDGLIVALRDESFAVAAVLLDWPASRIDQRNPSDETPLMMAALKGQVALVRRLIARGADVNKPGWTPLHYAATSGQLEILQILLDENAYIDAESPNGTTPLMMAAQYGSEAAVRLLLAAGADASLKNQLGLTAQDFAQRVSRQAVVDLLAEHLRKERSAGPRSW